MICRPFAAEQRIWSVVFLTALVFCGVSCSNGLQSVSGKVLHKSQPIKGALVTLHPVPFDKTAQTPLPSGVTGDDGTFTLTTGKEYGVAPGDYVVTVVWLQPVPAVSGSKVINTAPPELVDQLQGRYADREKSKLRITVKSGVSQLEPIQLN